MHASVGVVGKPAWSFQDEALPYLFPPGAAERRAAVEVVEPVVLTPWFLENRRTTRLSSRRRSRSSGSTAGAAPLRRGRPDVPLADAGPDRGRGAGAPRPS